MSTLDVSKIDELRTMARRGASATSMYYALQSGLDTSHILDLVAYFREAFHLTLLESKPLVALTRTDERNVANEQLLDALLLPHIQKRRPQWDTGFRGNGN